MTGDLPLICARSGSADAQLTPVWVARTRPWAYLPAIALMVAAAAEGSVRPLLSYWAIGAAVLPLVASRGTTGRVPLSMDIRRRRANLRRRRLGVMFGALLLTWLSVGLWLMGTRVAAWLVLAAVLTLYASAVAMFVLGRRLTVGGWPEADGGATLSRLHPDFVSAVELYRTGHRPG